MVFLPWTFALILNAVGYPGLEKLGALGFRFGLEVMGTAVLGACRAPLEKPPIGEFIKGRNYVFVIRMNIISRVSRQALEVLYFLQDRFGSVLRQHRSLSFAGFCQWGKKTYYRPAKGQLMN